MQNSNTTQTAVKEIIVDVRTVEEWIEDGHADCSVNYPLAEFDSKIEELKGYDKVILVCRSGIELALQKRNYKVPDTRKMLKIWVPGKM